MAQHTTHLLLEAHPSVAGSRNLSGINLIKKRLGMYVMVGARTRNRQPMSGEILPGAAGGDALLRESGLMT